MGAAVRKPESATKSGLNRLAQELRKENWTTQQTPSESAVDPGTAVVRKGVRWGGKNKSAASTRRSDDEDDEDDDDAKLEGDMPADYDYSAGFDSSSDEEIDCGSEDKVARVRKLMERPVGDAGAGKRVPDREIRTMLSDAHVYSQRVGMLQFVDECRQRLDNAGDGMEPISSAGRRFSFLRLLYPRRALCVFNVRAFARVYLCAGPFVGVNFRPFTHQTPTLTSNAFNLFCQRGRAEAASKLSEGGGKRRSKAIMCKRLACKNILKF